MNIYLSTVVTSAVAIYSMLRGLFDGQENEKKLRLEELQRDIASSNRYCEHLRFWAEAQSRVMSAPDITAEEKREISLGLRQYAVAATMHEERARVLEAEAQLLKREVEEIDKKREASRKQYLDDVRKQDSKLFDENTRLRAENEALRNHSTTTVRVREFMTAMGQAVHVGKPSIEHVDDKTVTLRGLLVLEEAIEFCVALGLLGYGDKAALESVVDKIKRHGRLEAISLVDAADALADIDYVVEGARLVFGIPRGPIEKVVHEANMRKLQGPVDPVTGKKLKPEGWVGPEAEIEKILKGE